MKYFLTLILLLAVSCSSSEPSSVPSGNKWAGNWLRMDGTYQLIVEQQEDGSWSAAYLNPHPIKVQKTELQNKVGRQHLVIVLNDVGYPGAVYDLVYSQTVDRLVGTYFNPNAGQTYDVSFSRQP